MNGSAIYEQTLLSDGLRNMKQLRDSMNGKKEIFKSNISCNFGTIAGVNDNSYRFIMERIDKLCEENLEETIIKLLDFYKIKHLQSTIPWKKIRVSTETNNSIFYESDEIEHVLLIICNNTLFVFKKFGFQNYLEKDFLDQICEKYKTQDYKYISLIEGEAYSDILNHNNDESDESRGTRCYSLEYFFNLLFGKEEYSVFKKYYEKYTQQIKEYFGIAIVKTLHPNTLFSFKDDIKKNILEFDYRKYENRFSSRHISDAQYEILKEQFLNNRYYELLIGKSEFSRCFISSEWLYSSFGSLAGSIDLTAISMGYFKALEQFMYELISKYTIENGYPDRKIRFPNKLIPLNDSTLSKEKNSFTIGSMVKFLTNNKFNSDLIRTDVNNETRLYAYDVLKAITDQRNGFFHKDNILDWKKVEDDRILAYTAFFILLSAFKFKTNEGNLKLEDDLKSNYEKICEYFDCFAQIKDPLKLPIVYINTNNSNFYYVVPDPNKKYNDDGSILFSGMYIKIPDKDILMKINSNEMEKLTIFQGYLNIKYDGQLHLRPSGPEKIVVDTGKFVFQK